MKIFIVAIAAVVLSTVALVRSVQGFKEVKDFEKNVKERIRDEAFKNIRSISRVSAQFAGGRITIEKAFEGYRPYVKFEVFELLELIVQVEEETRKALEEDKKETGVTK